MRPILIIAAGVVICVVGIGLYSPRAVVIALGLILIAAGVLTIDIRR